MTVPRHVIQTLFGLVAVALLVACTAEDPANQARKEAERVAARDWSHLAGLPDPRAIVSQVGHRDPLIAVVRQCQVATKLHELLDDDPLFAPPALGALPPAASRLRDGYRSLIDGELQARFTELRSGNRGAVGTWAQACAGTAPAWREASITDADWLALLQPQARDVATRQLAVYAMASAAKSAARDARIERGRQERWLVMAIGAAIMLLGVAMMMRGWRIQKELARYEFENRNPAGVVEFPSFEDEQRHRRRKYGANQFLYLGGAIVAILGVVVFLARLTG